MDLELFLYVQLRHEPLVWVEPAFRFQHQADVYVAERRGTAVCD